MASLQTKQEKGTTKNGTPVDLMILFTIVYFSSTCTYHGAVS